MRAGQYSVRLSRPRHVREAVQEGPRIVHRGRLLERLAQGPAGAQPLQIPRVVLAQIAPGARPAEVLDGTVHHPVELPEDLLGPGVTLRVALTEQLREQPRVTERAAGEHHGGGAGAVIRA